MPGFREPTPLGSDPYEITPISNLAHHAGVQLIGSDPYEITPISNAILLG